MGMLSGAKTVKKPAAKKSGSDKEQKTIPGLQDYASVVAVEKLIKGVEKALRYNLDRQMIEHFSEEGMKIGSRPPSFRGVEGIASASMELRSKSSATALTPDQIQALDRAGVSTQVVEDVEETYRINPAYLDNQSMLAKVEKALDKLGLPDDFIQKQESNKKITITETSLDEVFKKGLCKSDVEDLLKIVATTAIKPKLEGGGVEEAFEFVKELAKSQAEAEKEG